MSINDAPIAIRPLHAWQEYLAAEELQRVVWQMPNWRDVVPANLLITAHKNGGIALGAFAAEQLVGFAFSFLGTATQDGRTQLKHCSHMLAVLPAYQAQHIGVQLKFAQRAIALAQPIALMTWTYDPLLALNANLNLGRLGAIARHYIVNAYGEMTDGLNAGLPSDRFEVEWWMDTPRVAACAAQPPARANWDALVRAGAQAIVRVTFDPRGVPHIEQVDPPQRETVLVEIPSDFAAVKNAAPDRATEWRMTARQVFQNAFAAGYVATNFVFTASQTRAAYVLAQNTGGLPT